MEKTLKKRFYIISTICAIAIIIAICWTVANQNSNDSYDASVQTAVVSGTLAAMDQEDLLDHSTLVIRGKVVDQSEAFQIEPAFGDVASNFTDYYVEVYEVLRGDDAEPSDIVTVRIQGGLTNNLNVIAEEAADLNIDDEVLLYLNSPGMGSAYNTKGDYYYVVGEKQGAYILDKPTGIKSFYASDEEVFVNTDDERFEYEEISTEIETYTENNPVNENIVYDEFIENLNYNFKTGFITQEEYNELLAEAQQYATIVK